MNYSRLFNVWQAASDTLYAKCFLVQRSPCDELKFAKRFLCLIALIICERKTEKSGQRSTFYLSFDVEFCWRHSSKDDMCHRGDDRRQNNKKGNTLASTSISVRKRIFGNRVANDKWNVWMGMSMSLVACARMDWVCHTIIGCGTWWLLWLLYGLHRRKVGREIEAMPLPHTMDHMGHLIRNVLILFPTRPTDGECWSERTV